MTTATAIKTPTIGDNLRPLTSADQLAKDFEHVEQGVLALLVQARQAPPVIEDDEDLAIINDLVPKLRAESHKVDGIRDDTGRPHLDAKRTIDNFFKDKSARLDKTKDILEQRGTAYLVKKAEAERKRRAAEEQKAREEATRRQREADDLAKAGQVEQAAVVQASAADAHARADNAGASVAAKPSDLARTHTGSGTSTLADNYDFAVADPTVVDLNRLRTYFGPNDITDAIRRFVKAGGRELGGVKIFPAPKARFR